MGNRQAKRAPPAWQTARSPLNLYREDLREALGRSGKTLSSMRRAVDEYGAGVLDVDDGAVKVWSDLHLGHTNIIAYQNRPFHGVHEMNETLWTNWQLGVDPNDTLVCVGDIALGEGLSEKTWERVRAAPGRTKVLVVGNPNGHEEVNVKITGVDDRGESPGSSVEFVLDCCRAVVLSALDLEVGRQVLGYGLGQFIDYYYVNGALGDGSGKWRLRVESDHPTYVMSLLRSPTGHLTNLSSAAGASIPHMNAHSAPLPATEPLTAEVSIPDTHLQRIVEATLGKAEGASISAAAMATLTRLYAGSTFPWLDTDDSFCVAELTGLEYAVNLEKLYLSKNCVEDLTPLAGLTNLRVLDARSSVNIEDRSPLTSLTGLEMLKLSGYPTPASSLTNLKGLWVGGVSDFMLVANLTNLEKLNVETSQTTNLAPLMRLPNLKVLRIDHRRIDEPFRSGMYSDISPLASLTGLVDLVLRGQVEDITALSDMPALAKVFLPYNRIRDLSPLVANPGLGATSPERGYADYLYVPNNPLSDQSINQHIPALQNRGVRVDFRPTIAE